MNLKTNNIDKKLENLLIRGFAEYEEGKPISEFVAEIRLLLASEGYVDMARFAEVKNE